jgi:hypothetical protein
MEENLTVLFVVNGWLFGVFFLWIFIKALIIAWFPEFPECIRQQERDLELLCPIVIIFIWPWGLVQLILLIRIYWGFWST